MEGRPAIITCPATYTLKAVEGSKEKDSVKGNLPGVFCKKGVLKNFVTYTGKYLRWSFFLIKLQIFNLHLCQGRLRYTFFPVNFAEFLLHVFFKCTVGPLLLEKHWISLKIVPIAIANNVSNASLETPLFDICLRQIRGHFYKTIYQSFFGA